MLVLEKYFDNVIKIIQRDRDSILQLSLDIQDRKRLVCYFDGKLEGIKEVKDFLRKKTVTIKE